MSFEKNCKLLTNNHRISLDTIKHHNCEDVIFCTTTPGEQNLFFSKEDKYLYSCEGGMKEARNWLSSLSLDNTDVVYICGLDLGCYYRVIRQWLHSKASRYIVFFEEDLRILYRFLESDYARTILTDPQVFICSYADKNDRERLLIDLTKYFAFTSIKLTAIDYYFKYRSQAVQETHDHIRNIFSHCHSDHYEYQQTNFMANFCTNLFHLPSVYHGNKVFGKFKKMPAIICGAGPSLSKNFNVLKTLKDRALIFSGGTGVNVLSSNFFFPHLVAYIDPNEVPDSYDRSITNYNFGSGIFYRNRILPSLFKKLHGLKIFVNGCGGHPVADWVEDQLGIPTDTFIDEGYGVVNWCMELAYNMGCDPIILVGVDLAMTSGKMYSGDVWSGIQAYGKRSSHSAKVDDAYFIKNESNKKHFILDAQDIYGRPVKIFNHWLSERDWIADYARKHSDITIINATEGGIGFPGIENKPLHIVADSLLSRSYDVDSMVNAAIQQTFTVGVNQKNIISVLESLLESFCRADKICEAILDEVSHGNIFDEQSIAIKQQELFVEAAYRYIVKQGMFLKEGEFTRRCAEEQRSYGNQRRKQAVMLGFYQEKMEYVKQLLDQGKGIVQEVLAGSRC